MMLPIIILTVTPVAPGVVDPPSMLAAGRRARHATAHRPAPRFFGVAPAPWIPRISSCGQVRICRGPRLPVLLNDWLRAAPTELRSAIHGQKVDRQRIDALPARNRRRLLVWFEGMRQRAKRMAAVCLLCFWFFFFYFLCFFVCFVFRFACLFDFFVFGLCLFLFFFGCFVVFCFFFFGLFFSVCWWVGGWGWGCGFVFVVFVVLVCVGLFLFLFGFLLFLFSFCRFVLFFLCLFKRRAPHPPPLRAKRLASAPAAGACASASITARSATRRRPCHRRASNLAAGLRRRPAVFESASKSHRPDKWDRLDEQVGHQARVCPDDGVESNR